MGSTATPPLLSRRAACDLKAVTRLLQRRSLAFEWLDERSLRHPRDPGPRSQAIIETPAPGKTVDHDLGGRSPGKVTGSLTDEYVILCNALLSPLSPQNQLYSVRQS